MGEVSIRRAPEAKKPLQHFLERCTLGSGLADFESPRGAQADDGKVFAARGDFAHDRGIARVRSARPRRQGGGRHHVDSSRKQLTSVHDFLAMFARAGGTCLARQG